MKITETTLQPHSKDQPFPMSYYLNMMVFAFLNVADVITTRQALSNGANEMNEIGKLVVDSDAKMIILKTVGVATILATLDLIIARAFKEPKIAEASLVLLNTAYFLIALNNLSYII